MRHFTRLAKSGKELLETMKGANTMNAKRILVAMIICATVATIAGAQRREGRVEPQAKRRDITGTWLLTITPDEPGAPSFDGLYTFTSDGIALFSSVGPPIPGLGNPGQGIWERTGQDTFKVTWKQFTFEDIFTCNGSLVINSSITVNSNDQFTSHDTGAVYDLGGNVIFPIGGTSQGRRMTIN